MTANELADKCNRLQGEIILGFLADCATMLRQQQNEIEMLKKELQQIKIWCGKTQFVHDYSNPFIELQKASK